MEISNIKITINRTTGDTISTEKEGTIELPDNFEDNLIEYYLNKLIVDGILPSNTK